MKDNLGVFFLSALIVITGAMFGYEYEYAHQNPTVTPAQIPLESFGSASFTPAQIPQTTLAGAGVTATANTITLSSFTTRDGRPVVMSMLGQIGYATLEPGTSKEEIVSFTGITQNANLTAVLTGVARGLDFVSPYAASTTLAKAHSGGATFIISNTAPFYGQQFVFTNNPSTVQAVITFGSTTPPAYDFNPVFASLASTTVVSKGYVDSSVVSGGVPGSLTTAGLFLLASSTSAASSTGTGIYNAVTYNRVVSALYATDTPQNCNNYPAVGGCVVMSLLNGKLNQLWIDLTQAFTWTGLHTFQKGFTANATSTIAASSSVSNAFVLNGLAYAFPSVRGASSTALEENGSGGLTFEVINPSVLYQNNYVNANSNSLSTSTVLSITIPANTITNFARVTLLAANRPSVGNCHYSIGFGNGNSTTSIGYAAGFSAMQMVATLDATSTSAEFASSFTSATLGASPQTQGYNNFATVSLTSQSYIQIDFSSQSAGNNFCTVTGITVETL